MKDVIWLFVAVMAMVLCSTVYGANGWSPDEFAGATDLETSMAEARIGWEVSTPWVVGPFGRYFEEDAANPGSDWGVGIYTRLIVDPNATFPVANWLPKFGDWLSLPESMTAETDLSGKGFVTPSGESEDDFDFVGEIGAGAQIGPVFIEYTYAVVESGDADNPVAYS